MRKTCSVDIKCLSSSVGLSLPARCKSIELTFKISFLRICPSECKNRFSCFSPNSRLEETNHTRFLVYQYLVFMSKTQRKLVFNFLLDRRSLVDYSADTIRIVSLVF